MMPVPRLVPGLFVALVLATCALSSTSTAQSTNSDEQQVVVALPSGTSLRSALATRQLTPGDLQLRKTTQEAVVVAISVTVKCSTGSMSRW